MRPEIEFGSIFGNYIQTGASPEFDCPSLRSNHRFFREERWFALPSFDVFRYLGQFADDGLIERLNLPLVKNLLAQASARPLVPPQILSVFSSEADLLKHTHRCEAKESLKRAKGLAPAKHQRDTAQGAVHYPPGKHRL